MSVRLDPFRLIRARWCLLAAAQPVLAATGAPLPFRVTVDGAGRGVARYDASVAAGATLAWFGPDRAVLSCGDLGWPVPDAPGPTARLEGAPSWLEHVSALDHRLAEGRYGWLGVWDGDRFRAEQEPALGAPLPPVGADQVAAVLGAGLDHAEGLHHLVRMCEYEWLDAPSWWAAFGSLAPDRIVEEAWLRLRDQGLTQWTGDGPRYDGVPGPTPEQARAAAAGYARRRGLQIPDDVRVESALRTADGWRVRFLDYRDAEAGRPLIVAVPDTGPASIVDGSARGVTLPGTTPG